VIVLLFVRTFVAGSFRRALRDSWPLYLGLSAGWAILAALNLGGPRSATAGFHLDLPASVWWFTQAKVFWLYMQLACWPWPLLIHYEIPYLESFRQAWPWVLGLALLALAVLVQCARRRASGFLGAWVFAILAPTLVVPIITEVAAERRMYLPLAALAALAVVGGYALAQASARRFSSGSAAATSNRPSLGLVTAAVLGLAIVYGLVSALRLEAYQDGVTLWRDDLAHRPDDPVALINLGVELLNARQPGEAIEQFQRAIDMGGRLVPKARLELGTALLRTDRMAEAIEQLRLALGDMPESAKAHGYLGHALLQEGRTAEAIEQLKLSLEYLPDSPEVEQDLGDAYLASGRLQDAVAHYQRLVPLKPDQADAHRKLGVALGRLGAIDAATEQLEEAVRLEPDSAEAHQFLAVALINQNRVPEAIRHLERAMRLGLDTADVHHYLGVALYNVNRVQDAIDQFELALQKNPDHAAARASLEQARGTRRPGAAP
jgi:tetratricopeptide (TPR) repeat protein